MPEEVKIIPTVGRIVYYKSYGTPGGEYKPENRAAIITYIYEGNDEVVDLCVLNPTGFFFNRQVVKGQEGGQWDWMPYQKASASNSQSAEPRPAMSTPTITPLLNKIIEIERPMTEGEKEIAEGLDKHFEEDETLVDEPQD